MKSTTAGATIKALRRLFAAYGLPNQLVSDNGPQFTSTEFAYFLKANGIKHIKCAPYHPSSNGCAERFVQTFKRALRADDYRGLTAEQRLMAFLLTYRSSPHSTTGVPPCKLFLNRDIRTRMDLLRPEVADKVATKQAEQKQQHDLKAKPRDLMVGQRVMVRNMRSGPSWIPGTIVRQKAPLTYLVQVGSDQVWRRHVDHLRVMGDTPRELDSSSSTVRNAGHGLVVDNEFDCGSDDRNGFDELPDVSVFNDAGNDVAEASGSGEL